MDNRTHQIRRHIAARIAYARKQAGITQQDLADQLNAYDGEGWTRGVVANLETGRKAIEVADLCAIACVQDRTVTWYFEDVPASIRDHIPGLLNLFRYPEAAAA